MNSAMNVIISHRILLERHGLVLFIDRTITNWFNSLLLHVFASTTNQFSSFRILHQNTSTIHQTNPSFFRNLTHLCVVYSISFFLQFWSRTFKTNIYQHSNLQNLPISFYPRSSTVFASLVHYFFSLNKKRTQKLTWRKYMMPYTYSWFNISVIKFIMFTPNISNCHFHTE